MLSQTAIRSQPHAFAPSAFGKTSAEAGSLDETMCLMGAALSYPRNAEIFGEGERAEFIYKVVNGAVRTHKILGDGRRQIGAFYLPGDIFGLQSGDVHSLSGEAMSDTKVLVVKRSAFYALAKRSGPIAQEVFAQTADELRRMQKRILLLFKSAQERVASFLLEMGDRTPASNAIELPMPRQDIADYLGLTIETVSRTLTAMEASSIIELPTSRRVVVRNRPALNRLNG